MILLTPSLCYQFSGGISLYWVAELIVFSIRKYTIQFRYADNDQQYIEDVELTQPEYARVRLFLSRLMDAGEIRPVDPIDPQDIDSVLFPVSAHEFLSFSTLEQNWLHGSLIDMAGQHDIRL